VPVLVLTAIQGGDVEGRCAQLGATSFVRKPFEPDELVRAVGVLTDA
jgi:CheY-like chemotaxis protein